MFKVLRRYYLQKCKFVSWYIASAINFQVLLGENKNTDIDVITINNAFK